MKKKIPKSVYIIAGAIILITIFAFIYFNYFYEKESFSVNPVLIKLNIPAGAEAVNTIKITNNEKFSQNFKVYLNDLEGIVSISEDEFSLGPKESKELKLSFKDDKYVAGVFPAKVIVETSLFEKQIPIMLGIEDSNHVFAIILESIPKYRNVYPGGQLGVDINIFDIKEHFLKEVKADFYIKNFDDDVIYSDEGRTLIVDEKLTTFKITDMPKDLDYGDYLFFVELEYEGTKSVAGYLFNVGEEEKKLFSGDLKIFIIIMIVFVIGIVGLFFYFMKTRDELLIQLRRQQSKELERNLVLFRGSRKQIQQIKDVRVRKKKLAKLGELKKKIVKKIKIKQKLQTKELKRLKKKGKKVDIKQKLKAWENQGYKMFETEKEVKKISKNALDKRINKLKNQGYNTGFLKK